MLTQSYNLYYCLILFANLIIGRVISGNPQRRPVMQDCWSPEGTWMTQSPMRNIEPKRSQSAYLTIPNRVLINRITSKWVAYAVFPHQVSHVNQEEALK